MQSKRTISGLVSLSPSITREIVDLGSGDIIIGVTSYDAYRARGVEIVGTLVQPNIENILMRGPDIVVCSEEDSLVQNIDRIAGAGIAVRIFKRNTDFADICGNYVQLGKLLNRQNQALEKVRGYAARLKRIKEESAQAFADTSKQGGRHVPPRVALFVSHRPLMAVSEDSYIGGIIRDSGGTCAYGRLGRPYPLVSFESLVELDPDIIISITGEKDVFFEKLRDFPQLKCITGKDVYFISPDIITLYTPADYLESVRTVSGIMRNFADKRRKI